MQAAYRCGRYEDAAAIYRRLRNVPGVRIDPVILQQGLKIFGKLQDGKAVARIWSEATAASQVNRIVAGSRINAAASMGDIEGAAECLDYMISHQIEPDVPPFNSAINACANADPPKAHAAMYFYDLILKKSLQPTVMTFTSLVRAHRLTRAADLRAIRASMGKRDIKPDQVFAEAFMGAAFGGRVPASVAQVRRHIAEMSQERRQELQDALNDFKKIQVMTGLCWLVDRACSGPA